MIPICNHYAYLHSNRQEDSDSVGAPEGCLLDQDGDHGRSNEERRTDASPSGIHITLAYGTDLIVLWFYRQRQVLWGNVSYA